MAEGARPNVIWVFGDQHRAQSVGYAGDPNVCTPQIDRLAMEGLRLQGVAGCPLCCPYRGSLLSSRYPHQAVPGHEYRLSPELPTVAHAFREHGYHTGWFGKWHVDGHHERDGRGALHAVPRSRRGGFDEWLGYENNNSQYDCWVHGHRGAEEVAHERLPGYETDELTNLLLRYLRDRAADRQPFFAGLSVQPPHDPYVAPEAWATRHTPGRVVLRPNVPAIPRVVDQARRELAGYHAMIENLDHNLGRVRSALAELGLAAQTHLIFFSDHGDMHGSQGQFRKTSPWEESIRVPLVIGGVGLYGLGRGAAPALVNHVDLAPTSLGLCGLPVPAWMQGTDYSHRRLRGKAPVEEPDSAFLQLVVPTGHGHSTDRPWRGLVTRAGWKYVCLEHQAWLLFNLNEDPYEQANLAHNTAFATERRRLHERLRQWIAETGDEFALPTLD
ncbi:MAG: sulfatase [Fimbriimonadaceae bacterium]|nr:sulfatase [Fimbriimonadaceae bacterium]